MKMFFVAFGVGLFLIACISFDKPLTAEGQNVHLMKADPPSGCKEKGNLTAGKDLGDHSKDEGNLKNILRNKAADIGANYVRLETASTDSNGWMSMSGTAYSCPQ